MPVTNVKTKWVSGNLVFYDKSNNIIFTIDGTNRNMTFPAGSSLALADEILQAADIALAEGNILLGNAAGAAAALDGSTDKQILVGDGTTVASVALSGDATLANTGALTLAVPKLVVLTETHLASVFADGSGASGTKVMAGTIPAGAILIGSKVIVGTGLSEDTSCVLIIGDGSDTDRYNTSTIDVFTTAANGVESGAPSGDKLITSNNSPTLTITSNADITGVIAGSGSITVSIFYIATV